MTGEVPTWEAVARTHGRFLYNVAYRLSGNDDDAFDLVQEALLRVRKGLETYQPGSMEGWLSRIVTNVFLDEVRRRRCGPGSTGVGGSCGRPFKERHSSDPPSGDRERAPRHWSPR